MLNAFQTILCFSKIAISVIWMFFMCIQANFRKILHYVTTQVIPLIKHCIYSPKPTDSFNFHLLYFIAMITVTITWPLFTRVKSINLAECPTDFVIYEGNIKLFQVSLIICVKAIWTYIGYKTYEDINFPLFYL